MLQIFVSFSSTKCSCSSFDFHPRFLEIKSLQAGESVFYWPGAQRRKETSFLAAMLENEEKKQDQNDILQEFQQASYKIGEFPLLELGTCGRKNAPLIWAWCQ